MDELLAPAPTSRAEAVEACERFLAARWRRWRIARLGVPRELLGPFVASCAWHRLLRAASPAVRAHLRAELEAVLAHRPETTVGLALAVAVRHHELAPNLLRAPFLAFERDASLHAFTTRGELVAHCKRLAQPEGRLLLSIVGRTSERNELFADALATGVQLAQWIGGFRDELAAGQLRLPVDDLERFGVDLRRLEAGLVDEPVRRLVAAEIAWARGLLEKGWPLCTALGPRTGRMLAFFLRWNAASLAAVEARDLDILSGPPPGGWLRASACATASLIPGRSPRFTG